jgi:hypothetical protein
MISATCFFSGLSRSFDNFVQRCLRSAAYLNGVPHGARGGLRVRVRGLLTGCRRLCQRPGSGRALWHSRSCMEVLIASTLLYRHGAGETLEAGILDWMI